MATMTAAQQRAQAKAGWVVTVGGLFPGQLPGLIPGVVRGPGR